MKWSGLGDARLRALAAEKLTATQIGRILGVSRNAVIGRCHRAGIQLLAVQHPSYQRKPPPVRTGPRKRVLTPGAAKEPKPPRSAFRSVRFPPLEAPQPVPLFTYTGPGYLFDDVPAGGCMFYVNDVDASPTLFCGEPKAHKQSYCEGHCRVAYPVPSKPRTAAQREQSRRAGLAYVRAIRKATSDPRQPAVNSIAARIDEYGVAAE